VKPFSDHRRRLWILAVLGIASMAVATVYLRVPIRAILSGLPYKDSFTSGKADEWHAFGGTWELSDGAVRNESDERGAKFITGPTGWSDYSLEADIQLLGDDGDAGLIARSSEEENGVDAYNGYYAGLRTHDHTLVLGRADHGWIENQAKPIPGGVHPFHWYHLKLVVVACDMVASAYDPSTNATISVAMNEPNCQRAGRIGLRSYSSGGVWRNVQALRATSTDLRNATLQTVPQPSIDHVRASTAASLSGADTEISGLSGHLTENVSNRPIAQSIATLRLISTVHPGIATVRGVVVLTSPNLYVQDGTGGAAILQPQAPLLKVGDEVEVSGEPEPRDFSAIFRNSKVHLLWTHAPIPPLSVTASQAATGMFDSTFIELDGYLVSQENGPANTVELGLQKNEQSFRAIISGSRGDISQRLKIHSLLKIRGICTVASEYTKNQTPFAMLVPSADDVAVLVGPPWWSAGHLAGVGAVVLILILAAQLLYSRIEHWRLRAVFEERERLAFEIHDTIAQSFAGIGFQLQAIRNDLQGRDATVLKQLDLASELVRHSHQEARRSIATLRPESPASVSLLPALDTTARKMVNGGSVQVSASSTGVARSIPARTCDALYKIGQEAIANAIRHAQPNRLDIFVGYERRKVRLVIEDDGVGFAGPTTSLGLGLEGMRKRAESISAALQIKTSAGNGTRVEAIAPLPPRFVFKVWPTMISRYFQEG
jgi:signal transduction histidine kinase